MNCKPGDIAYITHPKMLGHMVSVLYAEPHGKYRYPDGYSAYFDPNQPRGGYWVVESLGSLFDAPLKNGATRATRFGTIADKWLRPIRDAGDDAKDEMLRPLPHEVTA